MDRDPRDRAPRPSGVRRSGAPEVPQEDRRLVPLLGTGFQVEAFPWTGGLVLWSQDDRGRWVRVALRR